MQGNPLCAQIMIAAATMHYIVEEKEIVESQQEYSELEGLFAFTMTGA